MINGAMFVNLILLKGGVQQGETRHKGISPRRLLCVMMMKSSLRLQQVWLPVFLLFHQSHIFAESPD